MNILGLEKSEELKQFEMHLNDRISKLTEQQLLAFRQIHLLATEKLSALIEIEGQWRLINGAESDLRKKGNKRTLGYYSSFVATILILNFISISSTEKVAAFLFVALWIAVLLIQDMITDQSVLIKKTILNTALVNLKSEIRGCGVLGSTADEYMISNRMCMESEVSSEPIRKKFYNDYRISKVQIQNDILNCM